MYRNSNIELIKKLSFADKIEHADWIRLLTALNSEENRLAAVKREELVHRNYDRKMIADDFADWEADFDDDVVDDDDDFNYEEFDFEEE